MEKKSLTKEKAQPYFAIPRKPMPREKEESEDPLYHIVIAVVFGIVLCLSMGVLDSLSQDETPATGITETIEYSG